MTRTQLAIALIAVWLILIGAEVAIKPVVTLIFGIVALVLVLSDTGFVARSYQRPPRS